MPCMTRACVFQTDEEAHRCTNKSLFCVALYTHPPMGADSSSSGAVTDAEVDNIFAVRGRLYAISSQHGTAGSL